MRMAVRSRSKGQDGASDDVSSASDAAETERRRAQTDDARRRDLAWSDYETGAARAFADYQQSLHDISARMWTERMSWLDEHPLREDALPEEVTVHTRSRRQHEQDVAVQAYRERLDADRQLVVARVNLWHDVMSTLAEPSGELAPGFPGAFDFAVGAADEGVMPPRDWLGDPRSWQFQPSWAWSIGSP